MDKCREAFENSLGHTDGFHDGYVTHNPITGMYESNDDDYECVADWLNGAWTVWQSRQSEFDAMTEALLNQTQLLAKQKVEVDEKGKRVKSLEKQLKRSMIAIEDGEIDWALKNIKKILRGNNANS